MALRGKDTEHRQPSTTVRTQSLTLPQQINKLEKRILQKKREPTILEDSRLGFIESVSEN